MPVAAQIGYGCAGGYARRWIEGHPGSGRIHPRYQLIAEGDWSPTRPGGTITWTVAAAGKPLAALTGLPGWPRRGDRCTAGRQSARWPGATRRR